RQKANNGAKVIAMVLQHRSDLAAFWRDDPRGQKLPEYFMQLAELIGHDNGAIKAEVESLTRNVDYIKVIVSSQQAHRKAHDMVESVDVPGLIDEALQLTSASYDEQAIEVVRPCEKLPFASLDRHKARQIVTVLLANARDAVLTNRVGQRRVIVGARRSAAGDLEIAVEDNGCGIDPQNLDRIFDLGFTT